MVMTDEPTDPKEVRTMTEEERIAWEERKAARRWQSGQSGIHLDSGIGHLGGAGASGAGPDIGGHRDERKH
jgi:hypothetical protein